MSTDCYCKACGRPLPSSQLGIDLDRAKGRAEFQGHVVKVVGQQALVLDMLVRAYPRGVSQLAMQDKLFGDRPDGGPLTARTVHHSVVSRLRKALGSAGWPFKIVNARGSGYSLARLIEPQSAAPMGLASAGAVFA